MTINEIELYDVEAVDEVLSHLSNGDANVIQKQYLLYVEWSLLEINTSKS